MVVAAQELKELLAAPAAANQHLQKPTAREASRVGGIQETSELICTVLCNSQQKPNVLKGESAKLLSRLLTAGKWKGICRFVFHAPVINTVLREEICPSEFMGMGTGSANSLSLLQRFETKVVGWAQCPSK